MIIKCKMCGGDIRFEQGDTVGRCEYCGSSSTIPKADEEQILNRFNRANNYRRQGEFDKAIATYEHILEEDDTDAEAHWGIVLSRYGIEYVEDPATGRRIPTCHRAQVESVLADPDYRAALKNAPDTMSRILYEDQAKEIAEIQKSILSVSQNEEPYDVFICYKETDEYGKRTQDSVIANDIYHHLTNEGYKVFYAAITLEDKLGTEYEPYIFAALNSAKVMLCIGTRPEYFRAVWVKNEWSRYLKLQKTDRSKMLIPCYRDMDAYELPEEFAHLQAQDMSKIGFIADLIRGIRKVVVKDESNPVSTASSAADPRSGALLKRAFICLEDKEWSKADELAEQVLNTDPENAEAYLVQLMSKLKTPVPEKLADLDAPFDDGVEYQRVIRFGSQKLKAQMAAANKAIRDRIAGARRDAILEEARSVIERSTAVDKVHEAVLRLEQIRGWKDADQLAEKGRTREIEIPKDDTYNRARQHASRKEYASAVLLLEKIPGWRDADALCREYETKYRTKMAEERDALYKQAKRHMEKEEYLPAIQCLEQLEGWKDADALLAECKERLEAEKEKVYEQAERLRMYDDIGKLEQACDLYATLGGWRDSAQKLAECRKKIEDIRRRESERAGRIDKENRRKYDAYLKERAEKRKALKAGINKARADMQANGAIGKRILNACRYLFLFFGVGYLAIGIKMLLDPAFVQVEEGQTSPVVAVLPLAAINIYLGIRGMVRKGRIRKLDARIREMEDELAASADDLSFEEFVKTTGASQSATP